MPGSGYLAINGNSDLSHCVIGNSGACVYTVYNGMTTTGYVIWVDAQGPKGTGSGNLWLEFTFQTGKTALLKIHSSTRKWHYEPYQSEPPGMVKVIWRDSKP